MVIEILSYNTSLLNPLLKFLIFSLFALGTCFFYQAWKKFKGGNIRLIAGALTCGGIAACIGAGARFLGDFLVDLKWLESTGAIIFALISLFVAWMVYTRLTEIAEAFGIKEGK